MNKNQIIKTELEKTAQLRLQSVLDAEANFSRAMKDIEFRKAELAKRELTLKLSKARGSEAEQIKKQYEEYQSKQKSVLNKLKLTPEDIKPRYTCRTCLDTGYHRSVLCACITKRVNSRLINQSGIHMNAPHNFDTVDENILKANANLAKIYKLVKNYCKNFPKNEKKNIVLIGDVGVGKTHLLECIANDLLNKNFAVVLATAYELNNAMIKAHAAKNAYDRDDILELILNCDLLIIDDLGSEIGSEAGLRGLSIANFFNVTNERQRTGKSTIISSNLTPQQIEDAYGNRIFSRLFDKRANLGIHVTGPDLRIEKTNF